MPTRGSFNVYQIGTAVALVSITSFFTALILVYFLRIQAQDVVIHVSVPPLLWVSTALILASSGTLELSRRSLRRGNAEDFRTRLRLTILLGACFLVSQLLSWRELVGQGVYMESNPRGSAFYVFTGLHGLHLLLGIGWLILLLYRRYLASAAALYWHFIGVLWILLFALLLVWR